MLPLTLSYWLPTNLEKFKWGCMEGWKYCLENNDWNCFSWYAIPLTPYHCFCTEILMTRKTLRKTVFLYKKLLLIEEGIKFHHEKTHLCLNKFTILPRGRNSVIYTTNRSVGWQREQTVHWIKFSHTCKTISFHIKWKLVVFYSSVFNILNHHQPRDQKSQGQEQAPTLSQKFRITFYKNRHLFTSPSRSPGVTPLFRNEPLCNTSN